MSPDHKQQAIVAAVQAAPSAATAAVANAVEAGQRLVFGLTLSEWSLLVAITFGILQIVYLIWKWRREWGGK